MYLTLFLPADGSQDHIIKWFEAFPLNHIKESSTFQVIRDNDARVKDYGIDVEPAILYQTDDGEALYAAAGPSFPHHPYTLSLELTSCKWNRPEVIIEPAVKVISEAQSNPTPTAGFDPLLGILAVAAAVVGYYRDQT